jgi:CRISPR/Cas system CMR-associated protein Cmr5 small subunit
MIRQQVWAKAALEQVQSHKGTTTESSFRSLCLSTPSLIQNAGLAQGLTILQARERTGEHFLNALASVLRAADTDAPVTGAKLQSVAVETRDLSAYTALTCDVRAVTVWLRRFAQTELKGDNVEGRHN